MVKIVYDSANTAKHSVFGTERVLGGRAINYGWRKPGDVFNVSEADIMANLDLFLAYPCKEKFTVEKGKLVSPCGEIGKKEVVNESLEDIPGIGPRLAAKFMDHGLVSQQKVLDLLDDELMEELSVPPASRKKIKEWMEQV